MDQPVRNNEGIARFYSIKEGILTNLCLFFLFLFYFSPFSSLINFFNLIELFRQKGR